MGADLYIRSVFDANKQKWEPQFRDVCERRDQATREGNKELAESLQREVEELYDRMYEAGYYRDSYNGTNLLNLLGISYWTDIAKMLDGDGLLPVPKAQELRAIVAEREVKITAAWLREHHCKGKVAEWTRYFVEKRQHFLAFLDEAISREEPVECSI